MFISVEVNYTIKRYGSVLWLEEPVPIKRRITGVEVTLLTTCEDRSREGPDTCNMPLFIQWNSEPNHAVTN